MSKKNVTNRVMAVVSSVSPNRGKPEMEICNRKKRGFRVNFFLIGVILALLPVVSSLRFLGLDKISLIGAGYMDMKGKRSTIR
ncbi:MAG: hypothetical protein V1897_16090 [Pseudomonadota bacterium]